MNRFHTMFGRGRGFIEYQGFTEERSLDSFSTSNYSTTRFASSSFKTFQKVYSNYEGLAKTYSRMRETTNEEEETRYLIKGRDFCIDLCGLLDILSPLMDMMIRVQAVHQYIWSITKFWPRIRRRLVASKEEIDEQMGLNDPKFSKELLPKLTEHFSSLSKENVYGCVFKNVSLTPGWMVVGERDDVVDQDLSLKKGCKKKPKT